MVARLIYGFRISVLFGLILAIISSMIGVLPGRCRAISAAGSISVFQRVIEVWTAIPSLYLLLILISVLITRASSCCSASCCCSHGCRWSGWCAPSSCAGRNFEYMHGGARARRLQPQDHVPAPAAERHGRDPDLPALHPVNGSITTLTALDFLGFGLPPGSPSLGELLSQGKANLQAPWLGLAGFFVIAIMLSLLIFIGEAVRDAFDPRKTFR